LGKLNVAYVFDNHYKDQSGVVIPRRIRMYSPDGELVAEGEFQNIKINSSLPQNLFSP
jgi:outer membrane lipoprotein-sorting protein